MHLPTIFNHLLLIQLEIAIQVCQDMVLDVPGRISNRIELRECVNRILAMIDKTAAGFGQRPLQAGILQRLPGTLLKFDPLGCR